MIATLSPNGAPAGSLALTVSVRGSNFVPTSTVDLNGSSRSTTYLSSSQLQARILAADLAAVGKATVTVLNPSGGGSSNAVSFTIAPDTISFYSSRALDGSNATNTNMIQNIWVMNPDGSGQVPLTNLTAAGTSSASPSWSPDGTRLIFLSGRPLDGSNTNGTLASNIWLINSDGSGAHPLTKITNIQAGGDDGVWSPDGTAVGFDSERALDGSDSSTPHNTPNVWVISADGTNLTPLTKLNASAPGPPPEGSFIDVWSPDGSKIAFESERALDGSDAFGTTYNIWVVNPDGSGATPLTKLIASGCCGSFVSVWSPDGSKIAFVSTRALDGSDANNTNNTSNVWVMNADGSNPTPLTKVTALSANVIPRQFPAWSPDGTKIAFSANRALDGSNAQNPSGAENIWVVNVDGSGLAPVTKLTACGCISTALTWFPDGSRIFFESNRALDGSDNANLNFTYNIWVINADGSGAKPLTKLTAVGAHSLSPVLP